MPHGDGRGGEPPGEECEALLGTAASQGVPPLPANLPPPSDGSAYVLLSGRSAGRTPRRTVNLRSLPRPYGGGAGHHDWTEDYRWTAVDHARSIQGVTGWLAELWYKSQGWIAVLLIGVAMGTVGAMVNVACLWMHQLTRGACGNGWWLPLLYCDPTSRGGQFQRWVTMLGLGESAWADEIQMALHVVLCCAMSLTACWLTMTVAPAAAGAGVPEIKAILGGARIKNIGSLKTFLTKWAGVVLAIGGHLSVGKAAPTVHLGFCIASLVSKMFGKYRASMSRRRELLTAGTAAGICVAFGAPLGGVLYAFEETASFFGPKVLYRSFVCSAAAALTLQLWDPYLSHKLTLFSINYHTQWNFWEVPFFVLVGALGGVVGLAWTRTNVAVIRLRQMVKKSGRYRPLLEVLLVTLFSVWLHAELLPNGRTHTDAENLQFLFHRCEFGVDASCPMTADVSLMIFVTKFILTAVSFGLLLPGGLFMPNLVLGATLGWTVGAYLEMAVTARRHDWSTFAHCDPQSTSYTGAACVVPSVYALVGAAAVMSGVTRLTISLVTIMFELTGGLEYILPITIGVMTAKWVAEVLGGHDSIYSLIMDVKGLEFLDPKTEVMTGLHAPGRLDDVLGYEDNVDALTLLQERQPLGEVVAALGSTHRLAQFGFPIVRSRDDDSTVVGFVSRDRLLIALSDLRRRLEMEGVASDADAPVLFTQPRDDEACPASDVYVLHGYVDHSPLILRESIDLARVVHLFRRLGLSSVLICNEAGKLRGWLSKSTVIEHLQTSLRSQKAFYRMLMDGRCPGGTLSGFELEEADGKPAKGWESVADVLPPTAEVRRRWRGPSASGGGAHAALEPRDAAHLPGAPGAPSF